MQQAVAESVKLRNKTNHKHTGLLRRNVHPVCLIRLSSESAAAPPDRQTQKAVKLSRSTGNFLLNQPI